jgi:hypothetical protein
MFLVAVDGCPCVEVAPVNLKLDAFHFNLNSITLKWIGDKRTKTEIVCA